MGAQIEAHVHRDGFGLRALCDVDEGLLHCFRLSVQNQQDGFISTAAGSVIDNATKGNDAYYYALSPGLGQAGPPKPFSLYGVEQQAAMVQDYYSLTQGASSQLNVLPVSSSSGALSSYQATLGTAGLAMPTFTGFDGIGADGGFLIYPNKPNNNGLASVYKK